MTDEFAIKVLNELRSYGDKFANIGFDRKEALDMAIKALEQGPILDKIRAEIEEEPYISKMEVLDIIDKHIEGSESE